MPSRYFNDIEKKIDYKIFIFNLCLFNIFPGCKKNKIHKEKYKNNLVKDKNKGCCNSGKNRKLKNNDILDLKKEDVKINNEENNKKEEVVKIEKDNKRFENEKNNLLLKLNDLIKKNNYLYNDYKINIDNNLKTEIENIDSELKINKIELKLVDIENSIFNKFKQFKDDKKEEFNNLKINYSILKKGFSNIDTDEIKEYYKDLFSNINIDFNENIFINLEFEQILDIKNKIELNKNKFEELKEKIKIKLIDFLKVINKNIEKSKLNSDIEGVNLGDINEEKIKKSDINGFIFINNKLEDILNRLALDLDKYRDVILTNYKKLDLELLKFLNVDYKFTVTLEKINSAKNKSELSKIGEEINNVSIELNNLKILKIENIYKRLKNIDVNISCLNSKILNKKTKIENNIKFDNNKNLLKEDIENIEKRIKELEDKLISELSDFKHDFIKIFKNIEENSKKIGINIEDDIIKFKDINLNTIDFNDIKNIDKSILTLDFNFKNKIVELNNKYYSRIVQINKNLSYLKKIEYIDFDEKIDNLSELKINKLEFANNIENLKILKDNNEKEIEKYFNELKYFRDELNNYFAKIILMKDFLNEKDLIKKYIDNFEFYNLKNYEDKIIRNIKGVKNIENKDKNNIYLRINKNCNIELFIKNNNEKIIFAISKDIVNSINDYKNEYIIIYKNGSTNIEIIKKYDEIINNLNFIKYNDKFYLKVKLLDDKSKNMYINENRGGVRDLFKTINNYDSFFIDLIENKLVYFIRINNVYYMINIKDIINNNGVNSQDFSTFKKLDLYSFSDNKWYKIISENKDYFIKNNENKTDEFVNETVEIKDLKKIDFRNKECDNKILTLLE